MKRSLLLMTILLSVGCSKNKVDKTRELNIDIDKIRQQQETAVRKKIEQTIEENRISTCEAEEARPGFLGRVKRGFIGIFRDEGFDIVFPKALTEKINTEIMNSIFANMDFEPTDFWNTLSFETSNELNEFLIDNYFEADDQQYKRVRDMAAFLFLFHIQMEEKSPGYELFLEDQEVGLNKLRVAFDESAVFAERKKLSFCEKVSYLSAEFQADEDYKKPSDILGRVTCERGDKKVFIEQAADPAGGTKFVLTQADQTTSFTVRLPRDAEIDPRSASVEMTMDIKQLSLDLDIEIDRKEDYQPRSTLKEYKPNSFSRLTLKGSALDMDFNMKNLRCKERKEVIYQIE